MKDTTYTDIAQSIYQQIKESNNNEGDYNLGEFNIYAIEDIDIDGYKYFFVKLYNTNDDMYLDFVNTIDTNYASLLDAVIILTSDMESKQAIV